MSGVKLSEALETVIKKLPYGVTLEVGYGRAKLKGCYKSVNLDGLSEPQIEEALDVIFESALRG